MKFYLWGLGHFAIVEQTDNRWNRGDYDQYHTDDGGGDDHAFLDRMLLSSNMNTFEILCMFSTYFLNENVGQRRLIGGDHFNLDATV
jgi:hypothetical protein